MLSEMFSVFQKKKNSFIKKSVEQSKNKSVKNLIIKKVSHESIVYFILKLSISIRLSTALLLWSKCKILKNFFRNDKLLEKITSSSYHMEQKTLIEASYIYNIHTGEKNFCSCCF